ncbi:uncharacterized protein (TIGR03083 family) [Kibdelosporangium banguiense]|uniref:Uncharacterized protein (TIGR03083 family) n=1 Tax=Kibdelosporangium banguiense TaxID=1365924 RepID=A0ABS4T7Z8_9PSEU|nr:maleylpyruvate isomerase family mycothiol-dependent enzyme [Kibdelosporangium banguiense]MBP2320535.1 uncharacterized protein (TIGR03083 family) [Kibdelosporangium banguiense]
MHVDRLREQTKAFADAVAGLDPDVQVPSCPEWSVRVLVGHIGQAHRWAAEIIRTGAPAGFPDPREARPGPDWRRWLSDGVEEMADALAKAGDGPVWTFVGPQPTSFWLRRMVNDTAVHYVDVAITAGKGYELAEDLAVDAIEEGLELLALPGAEQMKPALAELRGDGQTLRIIPEGRSGWLITRTPQGIACSRASADADVTMSGTAQDIVLVSYGRLTLGDVTVTGNRDLIVHWLEHAKL